MARIAVIGVLFISVFLMIRGISETWKNRLIPESELVPTPISQQQDSSVNLQPEEQLSFNPEVPLVLPDFNASYLFNEDRELEGDEGKAEEVDPADSLPPANDLGIKTDIEAVTYSGSIIGDNFKVAIISYTPDRTAKTTASEQNKSKASPSRRRSSRAKTPSRNSTEYARIKEGDMLSGYLVAAIDPDKIVFRKGQEAPIEKYIYDPDKKRQTPSRSSSSLRPSAATPRPRPTGSTSGRTTTSTGEKILKVKSNLPTRQNVTTRQPPPKPDTSRVSRRRRSTVTPPSGLPTIPPAIQGQ